MRYLLRVSCVIQKALCYHNTVQKDVEKRPNKTGAMSIASSLVSSMTERRAGPYATAAGEPMTVDVRRGLENLDAVHALDSELYTEK